MPQDAMPMYEASSKWHKKAERLVNHILNGASRNVVRETWSIFKIFPMKTICYLPSIFLNVNGLKIMERLLLK